MEDTAIEFHTVSSDHKIMPWLLWLQSGISCVATRTLTSRLHYADVESQ